MHKRFCHRGQVQHNGPMNPTNPVVTILPGVPGMESLRVDDGCVPYPTSTVDFVKVLREAGFEVQFTEPRETRQYVGHMAAEIRLPLLEMSLTVLAGVEGGLLVELIKHYLPDYGKKEVQSSDSSENSTATAPDCALLHVDWRITLPNGGEERFISNGLAPEVLELADRFERHVRDL